MLKNFCHRQHERSLRYFAELPTDIAHKNLLMLHRLNLCAVLLLILYSLATALIFRQLFLMGIYSVFFSVHIILLVDVIRLKNNESIYIIPFSCCVYCLS